MRVQQISVFMEKSLKRFKEVAEVLNEAGINIRAHSLVGNTENPYKILRMVVDRTGAAVDLLKNRGMSVRTTDVLAIELDDQAGGLFRVLELLDAEDLELDYTYAAAHDVCNKAVNIFHFDDLERASEALRKAGFRLIEAKRF
ncbi:MAG: amino acid-binding protein [Desulfobacterales bacterium]